MIRTLFLLFGGLVSSAVAEADGSWMKKVPQREHDRANPYQSQADAVAAGKRLFGDHCAPCHGENAEGKKKKPALTSERIQQQATEGDIHWLLVNGNMGRGMPSWAKLPDPQLWQLIAYIKSLH
jgi:mono/diheme cytochrome c family protein